MAAPDSAEQQQALELARRSVGQYFLGEQQPPDWSSLPSWLHEWLSVFVTLHIDESLRGCVGSLQPRRSLAEDIWFNARAAAFEDPRFKPLSAEEWPQTMLSLSVLLPSEALITENETELLQQLRPEVHGVTVVQEHRRATFLPEVWSHFSEPQDFLIALRQKAGLPPQFSAKAQYYRYATIKIPSTRLFSQ
ncbi:uncharacterized protein (TIGR00296 family)/AmmeMemoRadiSam system protein A [Permianibacter aggregans]|uniref:Uncharacterized protein (TIGR00296 family)/AmmeMemoRadiSam system protein A n=2 Tax=Permianibacter aggregans TaxID=1510150 RepID=A0A4R6ULB5_9GAMM|nr:uncharacterized protein (TIGR00296 family)/AmmeMemoRadiSam system protein A [Permianibacter aggregans]